MKNDVPWWRTLLAFAMLLVYLAALGAILQDGSIVSTLATAGTTAFGLLATKSAVEHGFRRKKGSDASPR